MIFRNYSTASEFIFFLLFGENFLEYSWICQNICAHNVPPCYSAEFLALCLSEHAMHRIRSSAMYNCTSIQIFLVCAWTFVAEIWLDKFNYSFSVLTLFQNGQEYFRKFQSIPEYSEETIWAALNWWWCMALSFSTTSLCALERKHSLKYLNFILRFSYGSLFLYVHIVVITES